MVKLLLLCRLRKIKVEKDCQPLDKFTYTVVYEWLVTIATWQTVPCAALKINLKV